MTPQPADLLPDGRRVDLLRAATCSVRQAWIWPMMSPRSGPTPQQPLPGQHQHRAKGSIDLFRQQTAAGTIKPISTTARTRTRPAHRGGLANRGHRSTPMSVPILSDLINPFGPQSAAGQALINSSYQNGPYAGGSLQRWSIGGNASHELGDAFHAGSPADLALGFEGEGARSLTPPPSWRPRSQTRSGLRTDIGRSGAARRRRSSSSWTCRCPGTSKSTYRIVEDRYSDFGETNNGKLASAISRPAS